MESLPKTPTTSNLEGEKKPPKNENQWSARLNKLKTEIKELIELIESDLDVEERISGFLKEFEQSLERDLKNKLNTFREKYQDPTIPNKYLIMGVNEILLFYNNIPNTFYTTRFRNNQPNQIIHKLTQLIISNKKLNTTNAKSILPVLETIINFMMNRDLEDGEIDQYPTSDSSRQKVIPIKDTHPNKKIIDYITFQFDSIPNQKTFERQLITMLSQRQNLETGINGLDLARKIHESMVLILNNEPNIKWIDIDDLNKLDKKTQNKLIEIWNLYDHYNSSNPDIIKLINKKVLSFIKDCFTAIYNNTFYQQNNIIY